MVTTTPRWETEDEEEEQEEEKDEDEDERRGEIGEGEIDRFPYRGNYAACPRLRAKQSRVYRNQLASLSRRRRQERVGIHHPSSGSVEKRPRVLALPHKQCHFRETRMRNFRGYLETHS